MRHLIDRLISECAAQNHKYERLSWSLVQDCLAHGDDGVGLLALAIGVANMGVIIPEHEPLSAGVVDGRWVPDPANTGWAGMETQGGKHLTDHRGSGLLIPHMEGESLRQVYNKWGLPPGWDAALPQIAYDFKRIAKSDHCTVWQEWASRLVQRHKVLVWSVEWWMKTRWNHRLVVTATTLQERVFRARVANSRAEWLRLIVPGSSIEKTGQAYVDRKTDEGRRNGGGTGGKRSQKKAQRQVANCMRVVTLMETPR